MLFIKQLKLLPTYLSMSLKRESEYKISFYLFIINQLFFVALWLVFWRVLLNQIGDFGQWGFPLVALITGFVTISQGISFMFIYIYRVPTEILTGQLNSYLTKPVHPFVHMVCKYINLRSTPRIFIGAGITIAVIAVYNIPLHPVTAILALLTSIVGFLVIMIPFAMMGLLAFWIGKAEFLRDLFVELFVFQNYPLTEFPNIFVVVFTFVLPLIFSGTIPVLMLTQWSIAYSLSVFGVLFGILMIQIIVFNIIWKRGLRRYESYGG